MSSTLRPLGYMIVTSPGSLIRATHGQADPAFAYPAHAFMVQAGPSNVGKCYVGLAGFSRLDATGAGLLAVIAVPTINTIPAFSVTIAYAMAALNMADIWIDADNANDRVLITAVVG